MDSNNTYLDREIDEKFSDIKEALDRIERQTTRTNGRVTKLERFMMIVGTAVAVLLFTNGSQLIGFLMSIV